MDELGAAARHTRADLIVNLRAQARAETLETLARTALTQACETRGAVVTEAALDRFHPGFPNPTHRLA